MPAALSTPPAQGSPATTELQGSVPSPALVLSVRAFPGYGKRGWDPGAAAPVGVSGSAASGTGAQLAQWNIYPA